MAELETDNEEKPLEPPSIKKTEILSNPFEDITPRDIRHKTVSGSNRVDLSRLKFKSYTQI